MRNLAGSRSHSRSMFLCFIQSFMFFGSLQILRHRLSHGFVVAHDCEDGREDQTCPRGEVNGHHRGVESVTFKVSSIDDLTCSIMLEKCTTNLWFKNITYPAINFHSIPPQIAVGIPPGICSNCSSSVLKCVCLSCLDRAKVVLHGHPSHTSPKLEVVQQEEFNKSGAVRDSRN